MVHFYQTKIRNSEICTNEHECGNYNHKIVPMVKVTLEDTKLYFFGAEMRETLDYTQVYVYYT